MRHLIYITILILLSCDNHSREKVPLEYKDGRQLLTLNEQNTNGQKLEKPKVILTINDSARIGEEFIVKISLSDKDFKIKEAFVDCETEQFPSVDTLTYDVSGCKLKLFIESDTVIIAFQPRILGHSKFSEITLLTQDKENVFRTMKYTFDYNVTEN